jgi:hypothetical protein
MKISKMDMRRIHRSRRFGNLEKYARETQTGDDVVVAFH